MRIEGTLTKWNDDRGFGFITPDRGGSEIFVHISAFPKDGCRPTIGERLTFEIEVDSGGKKRAKYLLCPDRPVMRSTQKPVSRRHDETTGFLGCIIPLLIVLGLAFYGYREYSRRLNPQAEPIAQPGNQDTTSAFRCDGRTHCSEMTSCAEATFFLNNCPNVQMDGNHDGVPCEQQWCSD